MSWKIISSSQKTGNDWISILKLCCSSLWFLFRELPDDFGIDGQVEILKDGEILDIKFEVQVKTSDKFVIENDRIKVRSISRDDLQYWNSDTNMPVFIIAVERNTKKCFWVDIRDYLDKLEKDKKQKTILIFADLKNELCEKNKNEFLNFVKDLNLYTSKRNAKKSSVYERLKICSEEKWYATMVNIEKMQNALPIQPTFIFSEWANSLWLFETEESKNHPITGNFQISKYEWYWAFEVKNFSLKLGDSDIVSNIDGIAQIQPIPTLVTVSIITKNYRRDIIGTQEFWLDNDVITTPSEGEISLQIKIWLREPLGKINLHLETHYVACKTITDLLNLLNFVREIQEHFELKLNINNQEINLFEGSIQLGDKNEQLIFEDYVRYIKKIEGSFDALFNVSKIIDWFNIYIQNPMLRANIRALANWNDVLRKCTIRGSLNRTSNAVMDGEQYIKFEFTWYELFWVQLSVKIILTGKWTIKEIWKKIEVKSDEIIITSERII